MKLILIVIMFALSSCSPKYNEHSQEIADLQAETRANNQLIADLYTSLQANQHLIDQLRNSLTSLTQDQIADIQFNVETLQVAYVQLVSEQKVVGLIDFCGEKPGAFNEVGLRLSNGDTLVFFESQGNRFLTVLQPSRSYSTTDGTACSFTTNAAGLVCDNLGCR
jgi:hypothetical protein